MSEETGTETGESLELTETEIRSWIGSEIDSRLSGMAKKEDITTAIADAFKALPTGGSSSSSSMNEEDLLSKIGSMIDERLAKNSRRNPGFLTKILAG